MKNLGRVFQAYRCSTAKPLEQALKNYYKKNEPLKGYCSQKQTLAFSKIDSSIHQSHWRQPKFIKEKLKLSSLGIGTQSGDLQPETDLKMFQILFEGIKSGRINVIDTDINFRYGKSQKTINAVLNYLKNQHKISRQSIFVATKCGYLPNDVDSNLDEKQFLKIMTDEGYITNEDVVNQIHCMHPNFIKFCTEKSLYSLGLETIDLLYLNNPVESQQTVIGRSNFLPRLQKAFGALQELRSENKIRYYGIASFVSFRSPPSQLDIHSDLVDMIDLAKKVGGKQHGLRFILVPFNLGMPQIMMNWQVNRNKKQQHLFTVCKQNSVNINLCCPLFQGRVASVPFKTDLLNKIQNNTSKHLQLVRSLPKEVVLSTIFSTLNVDHLYQNLETVEHPFLTSEQWKKVLPLK